ncbi:NAD(P)-dependent oxidoreductase [Marivivens niveibacter]|uniref:NAD(P)-dependent oxidoreductase n=1 Tax=Marivivens niveibacter TaxID=1930667 RepID=A0A251WZL1_9RHOB|nr:SDR family oxidoreductase [Marivivens niveibacter]OUD09919.1 NAD(P)-dependent oxidoreductase [Marivivens niveibacter]
MKTLLSFGHGFSARALTRILPDDWTVIGTTRSADKADALTAEGIEARVWPGTDITADLDRATHLLISAGPNADGDPVLNEIKSEIAARRDQFEWVGYLSTTGTYGDHGGAWIDESTPVKPSTERGEWRARAEAEWQSLDLRLHIFRLAGIYGPGRGPFAKVRSGKARRIIKEGQVFSRTHVDDIAQVLLASINKPNPGAAYNVCDDEPAPPQDVIEFAANLLGLPVPPAIPIEDAPMTPMAASFYAENKRVRNDRIKDELGVKLLYPDYRTGLRALLAQSGE